MAQFKIPRTSFNNNFQNHLLSAITETSGEKARQQNGLPTVTKAFAFFINGGLDKDLLEKTYIETLQLLSTCRHWKGDDQFARYFMNKATILEMEKKEEIKDKKRWCSTCLQLADIYLSKSHFAQTEYCLLLANAVLPRIEKNQGLSETALLQAHVCTKLGMYFLEKLEFIVQNFKHDKKAIQEIVNNQDLYLETFANSVQWPELHDMTRPEDAYEPRDLAL